ncbi:hypothetical protein DY000_02057869 [Brassica cretica]|uniref:FAD-binding PCMH-type domain-containing protein n=1 Tax=Brassica cretica TaxID=69181 RepID=A0ABQ7AMN1_BRACR|nr:hypothetical protein DY000_02057869 [Brassica cretica]
MSSFRDITVEGETAWIGAGITLDEVYYRIWEKTKTHGFVCPTVGAGGHISGGGYGNMIRKYGLSVDYVTDTEIVDVNGRVLDRKGMGEDLFWAIQDHARPRPRDRYGLQSSEELGRERGRDGA